MRIYLILFASILFVFRSGYAQICYNLSGSDQLLTIDVVSNIDINPPSNTFITGLFTIAWDGSLGPDVIDGISVLSDLPFDFDPAGDANPRLVEGKYYQKFGFTTPSTQSLVAGQGLTVLEISVSHQNIEIGNFELVPSPPISGGDAAITNFFAEQYSDGSCELIAENVSLPITLLDFSIQNLGYLKPQLNWTTESEIDFSHFEIERSIDAKTYKFIGRVDGENNGNNSYTLIDDGLNIAGTYYYRLKMVDLDGRFDYSKILNITYVSNIYFSAYPNPSRDQVQLQYSGELANKNFTIIDRKGNKLKEGFLPDGGSHSINVSDFSSGIYYINVDDREIMYISKKLIIIK